MFTDPFERFSARNLHLIDFLNYITALSSSYDTVLAEISECNVDESEFSEELVARVNAFEWGRNATDQLGQHIELVWELILCRSVDEFLLYLSDLIATIFRDRPETLRSSRTFRIDAILQHSTMEELVASLADKRVTELAYLGMYDLVEDLRGEFGFDLFPSPERLSMAIKLIELRNLIVHNGGVVNKHFLSRAHGIQAVVGQRLHLGELDIADSLNFLRDAASDIDIRAIEKFGLATAAREDRT